MTAFVVFAAILAALVTVVIVGALRERSAVEGPLDDLPPVRRKEAALEALRDLEFERETGKLPEEEYQRLHDHYARIALAARDEANAPDVAAARDGAAAARDAAGAPDGDNALRERPP